MAPDCLQFYIWIDRSRSLHSASKVLRIACPLDMEFTLGLIQTWYQLFLALSILYLEKNIIEFYLDFCFISIFKALLCSWLFDWIFNFHYYECYRYCLHLNILLLQNFKVFIALKLYTCGDLAFIWSAASLQSWYVCLYVSFCHFTLKQ